MKHLLRLITFTSLLLGSAFAATVPYTQDFETTPGASGTAVPADWFTVSNATANGIGTILYPLVMGKGSTTAAGWYNCTNKIGVLTTSAHSGKLGYAITNLNTVGSYSIRVKWDGIFFSNNGGGRSNKWTLSYRVGDVADFTDLSPIYDNYVPLGGSKTIANLLPGDAGNKVLVQLRWISADNGGAGSRPTIALDNITIEGKSSAPWVGCTNGNFAVSMSTATTALAGTNNTEIVGNITASNILNGATAEATAGNPWWQMSNIVITDGINVIVITATNDWGAAAYATVSVTRATLPFYDGFNYSDGLLRNKGAWKYEGTSFDNYVSNGNLSVAGLAAPTGKNVYLSNNTTNQATRNVNTNAAMGTTIMVGQSAYDVFASFALRVDSQLPPVITGLFILGEAGYNAVVMRRNQTDANKYDIGLSLQYNYTAGTVSPNTLWDTNGGNGYPLGVVQFLVMRISLDSTATDHRSGSLWINPSSASFGTQNIPTPLMVTSANAATAARVSQPTLMTCNNNAVGGNVYVDELRYGLTWADVTPPYAGAITTYVADVTVPTTLSVAAVGDVTLVTNLLSGTGKLTKSGAGNLQLVGTIAPGTSPGTLTIDESNGTVEYGIAGDMLALLIEDGDVLSNVNLDAAVNLNTIIAKYQGSTEVDTTNWFLYANTGFTGTLSNEFGDGYHGYSVISGNFIGAVVVPEPALLLGLLALLPLRRRQH